MRFHVLPCAAALLILGHFHAQAVFAEDDATLDQPAAYYEGAPTPPESLGAGGDVAEADVEANGAVLQYTGLVLNGDGVNPNAPHPFLKVQAQGGSSEFTNAACYLGNNASAGAFGLVFFSLSQAFRSAHMRAERIGTTVVVTFSNVDGGTKANQVYTCDDAPAAVGDKMGVLGFQNTAELDNFGDGNTVLDTFNFVGPLASSGDWFDAAPGMNADGSVAKGGSLALSFFTPDFIVIDVDIDIKPGSDLNSINLMARWVVPVAILGSDDLDVGDVDVATLAFGPDGAGIADGIGPLMFDVNGDEFTDLLSHYPIEETGIALGDTQACLTGELLDGTPLEGCDTILAVALGPCGLGFELVFLLPPLMWVYGRRSRLIH